MFKESDNNFSGTPAEDFGVVRTFALKLSFQPYSTNRTPGKSALTQTDRLMNELTYVRTRILCGPPRKNEPG